MSIALSLIVAGCPKKPTEEDLQKQRQQEILEQLEEDLEELEDAGPSDAPDFMDAVPDIDGSTTPVGDHGPLLNDVQTPYEIIGC